MIEISFGKLLLLALIALMVLGPEKLPGAARTAGALLRRVRSGWDSVRTEVERELEIEEIRRAARETVAQAKSAQAQVQDAVKSVHGVARDMGDDVRREAGDIARKVKSIAEPPGPSGQAAAEHDAAASHDAGAATQRALTSDGMSPLEPRGEPLTRQPEPVAHREPPHGNA